MSKKNTNSSDVPSSRNTANNTRKNNNDPSSHILNPEEDSYDSESTQASASRLNQEKSEKLLFIEEKVELLQKQGKNKQKQQEEAIKQAKIREENKLKEQAELAQVKRQKIEAIKKLIANYNTQQDITPEKTYAQIIVSVPNIPGRREYAVDPKFCDNLIDLLTHTPCNPKNQQKELSIIGFLLQKPSLEVGSNILRYIISELSKAHPNLIKDKNLLYNLCKTPCDTNGQDNLLHLATYHGQYEILRLVQKTLKPKQFRELIAIQDSESQNCLEIALDIEADDDIPQERKEGLKKIKAQLEALKERDYLEKLCKDVAIIIGAGLLLGYLVKLICDAVNSRAHHSK